MIRKTIIFFIYYIFYFFIINEIRLKKKIFYNKKFLYPDNYGFGDFIVFCENLIGKLNKSKLILCYSRNQLNSAKFFFDSKYISRTIFILPSFLNETHLAYNFLTKSKNFAPLNIRSYLNSKVPASELFYANKKIINYIRVRLKKFLVSNIIKDIVKKKTICLFIKHYSNEKFILNYGRRQTSRLDKIYKLIKLINKKKFNIIILGTNNDLFIKKAKIKFANKEKKYNIHFFTDISNNYSIAEQAYVATNSSGYIGSQSGAAVFFMMLNKKSLLIDATKSSYNNLWKNNILFLYKKIKKKNTNTYNDLYFNQQISDTKHKVKEIEFRELKYNFFKKFN
jgi:hypothetical protein